jgi:Baculovirus VP1054 protein
MSSTRSNNLVRFKQCVSEKLIPFKPIKRLRTQCCLHPLRANCRANKQIDGDDDSDEENIDNNVVISEDNTLYHETKLNVIYLNYKQKPYYKVLLRNDNNPRGYYNNAEELYAYVHLIPLDDDEVFYGIDESGERQMKIINNTIKTIFDAFENCKNYVILCADELIIDLVYSIFRSVILPQRMIAMHFSDNVPILKNFTLFSVPTTTNAIVSQQIYRTFLVYNTVMTMILKQRNPFNEPTKSISVIFRNLGKCPQNNRRVKCCDLKYGGNTPGHVMCAPREMLKRIFHYAKWVRAPNNYKRYYELITKPASVRRKIEINAESSARDNNHVNFAVMDWYNFMQDFRAYFGIEIQ